MNLSGKRACPTRACWNVRLILKVWAASGCPQPRYPPPPSYSFWYNAGAIGSVVLQKRHEPLSLHSEILTSPICMMIEDDEAGPPRIMPYSGRSPLRRIDRKSTRLNSSH